MRPVRFVIPALAPSVKLDGRAGRITWYSFIELSGVASASFILYDGNDNTGQFLMGVNLLPSESTREYTGHHGFPYENGLYLQVITGTIQGIILCVPENEWVDLTDLAQALGVNSA